MWSLVLILVCSIVLAAGAEKCPDFGLIPGFEREGLKKGQYLGRWFEQRSHATFADISGKCWSKLYSRKYRNNPYDLVLIEDYESALTGFSQSSESEWSVNSEEHDANVFVPNSLLKQSVRVVATDYDSFSIEYACSDSSLISRHENIWLLTRKRRPPRRVIRKAMNALRELGLSTNKLVKTDQSCRNQLSSPPPFKDSIRRNFEAIDYEEESAVDANGLNQQNTDWITPIDLAKGFMGSIAGVGQAIFAPWTLPGEAFSVRGPKEKPTTTEANLDYY